MNVKQWGLPLPYWMGGLVGAVLITFLTAIVPMPIPEGGISGLPMPVAIGIRVDSTIDWEVYPWMGLAFIGDVLFWFSLFILGVVYYRNRRGYAIRPRLLMLFMGITAIGIGLIISIILTAFPFYVTEKKIVGFPVPIFIETPFESTGYPLGIVSDVLFWGIVFFLLIKRFLSTTLNRT